MAIEINGKVYRNIQEQVAKNQEDIDDLNHRIPAEPHFYTKEETDDLLDTKQDKLVSGDIDSFNLIYPVGSIYMSVVSTNPSTLFGGTWEQLKDRFLLGAGDTYTAGATGGEATHTLTVNEMPSHSHNVRTVDETGEEIGSTVNTDDVWSKFATSANTENVGGNQPHNNMPPYLVVYMWKRTA